MRNNNFSSTQYHKSLLADNFLMINTLLHSIAVVDNIASKKPNKRQFKLNRIYIACLFFSGLLNVGLVHAQTIITGPITGNQNFTTDTKITLSNSNNNMGAVTVNSGETVTASSGSTITVEVEGEATPPTTSNNGLVANTGGTIDLTNNKVIISNTIGDQSKLGIGIFANGGTVNIGDGSEIYALKASTGTAVSTNNGKVNIGDNAILQGTVAGGAAIVSSGTNGNIKMGEGATIVNDGSADSYGNHRAVYAMNGSRIEIGSGSTIETKGVSSSTNHGVQAGELGHIGTVVMGEDITISTQGTASYGIFAYNTGSSITAGKTTVTTTGNNGYAIVAGQGAIVELGAGSSINTSGQTGHGINAQANGQVKLGNGSTITTSGNSTIGASSHSGAVVTLGNNMTIKTSGTIAYGMQSDGTDSKINVGDNFIFESINSGSRGVQARRGGEVTLGDDASITTNGQNSWGINSNGDTSFNSLITTGLRTTIITTGDNAHGVGANNNGRLVLGDYATIDLAGDGAMGAFVTGANTTVTTGQGANITTRGTGGRGVYGTNGGSISIGQASTITTIGQQAQGIYSIGGNTVINTGIGVNINTAGDDSYGVHTNTGGTVNLGNNNRVTTTGAATHGVVSEANSQIVVGTNAVITTDKDASYGVLATGANANITLGSNASIISNGINNTHSVYTDGSGTVTLNSGATITTTGTQATNSYALYATGTNSYINGSTAGVYRITGDINSAANGQIDLNMAVGSTWRGASYLDNTSTTNATMSNSNWAMTANSQLTSLNSQNSTVNYQSSVGNYLNLTTGSLAGNGIFAMKVDMENMQGDLLQVTNANVVGNHRLSIANVGSANTTGNETLTVVETLDNTQGAFSSNTVEAGAYQYKLRQAANNTSWELYGAGARRTTTADASVNVFSTNYLLSYIDTQTLLQRMGQLRSSENQQGDFWIRGFAGKLNSFGGNVVSGFDMNYKGTQAGIDKLIDTNTGRLYVGGMVGFTDADPNYHGGHGTTKDYHFGLYSTYITDNGLYMDGVLKYTHMKNRFNVKDTLGNTVTGKGNSEGYSASLEIGKRFYLSNINSGYYLEPQGQVTYGYQGGMNVNGSNGLKTKLSNYNYTQGRASALMGYTIEGTNPIDIYFKTGYVREFDGKTSYTFNQGNKINHSFKGGWWDNGIGVNAQIKGKHNVYADINYAKGSRFDQKQLNLGYRYSF